MNNLIIEINMILSNNYPIKTSFNNIHNLSHFWIMSNDWNKFIPFQININGDILTGQYKNKRIKQVVTNKIHSWNEYLLLYTSILNIHWHPCIDENKFLCLIHTYNFLDDLNIKKIIIKDETIDINYIPVPNYKLPWTDNIKPNIINKDNHFYFDSFDVNKNHNKIGTQIMRLIKNRDKYNSIHFHLDNNGGGDIVPAHLILRCLVGKKEKWMKNIQKILTNKKIEEWDCWKEENGYNSDQVKKLNLDLLPDYKTKYTGKIYLYMNKKNGSAAWYFITYLIYAFSAHIKRFTKKCYGQTFKFGSIDKTGQLIIKGYSGTSSGDGNAISIKFNNINIFCPTEQFTNCSIKKKDWNRFWIE